MSKRQPAFIRRLPTNKETMPDNLIVNGALVEWYRDFKKRRLHLRIVDARVKVLTREPPSETLEGIEP